MPDSKTSFQYLVPHLKQIFGFNEEELVIVCSSLVIFASTTNTPASVISGCTGCLPSDRNSCAYLSRKTAILMAQDSG